MKTWFQFQAKADSPSAEVSIYDEIGMWGVTAKDFINELQAHKGKSITLSINSPGGSVFDALAIYNSLRSHGSEVTVKVMGIAASAASLIAMAGDKIVMPENTFMMIHNPWSFAAGNAEELRDFADTLDKIGSSLVKTYMARTGKTEEEIKELLAAETWLTAAEAVEMGFADEVEAALKIAASFDTERLPENIKAVFVANSGEPGDESAEGEEGASNESTTEETAAPSDDNTLASQINSLAVAAGFGDLVGVWALDETITSKEQAEAAISVAREIRSLCAVAKQPEMAVSLIRSKATLSDARKQLCAKLASEDEATHTSNVQNTSSKPPVTVTPKAAIKTADIWASRKPTHH